MNFEFVGNTADMCQCAGCFEARQATVKSQKRIALNMATGLFKEKSKALGRTLTKEETITILKSVGFK